MDLSLMRRLCGAVLSALAIGMAGCGPPALVSDGRPEATIVVSPSAKGDESLAATELRDYVAKISGASLTIQTAAPKEGTIVRIGVYGAEPVRDWSGPAPPPDGFALRTVGNELWIVGGDVRGALYGVYDLLETELGVRWFMPGELGEDVPSQKDIPMPKVDREKAPAFSAVGGFIWAGGPGANEWEKRARARVGPTSAFFGHNWYNIIPPTAETKAAHPEWFALSSGVRTNQLCSAHPDVVRITVEKARAFFDANPSATLFSISPNDGSGFCEDARCQAVDQRYGVTDGTLSDRLVHYANEVLAELGKAHPGKQVGILAYVQHTAPPRAAKPHPNYVTLITRMPWEFCHAHALDDPACELNRRFLDYVRGWRSVAQHVGVYDYYGHFYMFTPWPLVHSIRRDLPLLKGLGVDRFMSETQQHWANQGLNFYVGAKLAWDPSQDTDRLLTDYYVRFYGAARAPMRRYWERWEQAMAATVGQGHGGYQWLRMFTPNLVAETDPLLAEAERLAASDRDKVRQRVAFARQGFRFTEAWTRMHDHAARQEWRAAVAAGEEAIRRIRETAGTQPQAFWIELAVSQTEAMMKPYREALAGAPASP
jgi:Domain of unknown function (DUF4838)/Glycosyl hydrolase family 67 N-terminus